MDLGAIPQPVLLVGALAGTIAAAGVLFLVTLLLSQRRDLRRIRAWRELEPDRGDAAAPIGPAAYLTAAAGAPATSASPTPAPLDGGAPPGVDSVPGSPGVTPASSPPAPAPATASRLTPAERVTLERPAIDRITGDRAALEPESRAGRVWRRMREPRHPLLIAAAAFLVGAGIFVGSLRFLGADGDGSSTPAGAVVPAEVEVAVLNGTSTSGLADKVSDDVRANGYTLGPIANSRRKLDRTIVLFSEGSRKEAASVARDLGLKRKDVEPFDARTERASEGADVVVIAGEDRARV